MLQYTWWTLCDHVSQSLRLINVVAQCADAAISIQHPCFSKGTLGCTNPWRPGPDSDMSAVSPSENLQSQVMKAPERAWRWLMVKGHIVKVATADAMRVPCSGRLCCQHSVSARNFRAASSIMTQQEPGLGSAIHSRVALCKACVKHGTPRLRSCPGKLCNGRGLPALPDLAIAASSPGAAAQYLRPTPLPNGPGASHQYLRYAVGLPAMSRSASTISLTSCCSEVF